MGRLRASVLGGALALLVAALVGLLGILVLSERMAVAEASAASAAAAAFATSSGSASEANGPDSSLATQFDDSQGPAVGSPYAPAITR